MHAVVNHTSSKYTVYLGAFFIIVAGFDTLGVNISGANLRANYLVFILGAIFLFYFRKLHFSVNQSVCIIFVVGMSLFAINSSATPIKSFAYTVWMLVNYICVFGVFRYIARSVSIDDVKVMYCLAFRVQVLMGIILSFLLSQERMHFFYFEPSYFAIASIPYVAIVFERMKANANWFDLLIVVLMLIFTKSAVLIMIVVVLSLLYLISGFRFSFIFVIKSMLFAFLALFTGYLYVLNSDDLLATTLLKIINSPDTFIALLERSGNRWPRMLITIDAIYKHFPFGIGAGAFESYSYTFNPGYDYSQGLPWLEPRGLPAINMWLEMLLELGLSALLGFGFFCCLIFSGLRNTKHKELAWVQLALITFIIVMCWESNYLRVYLWGFLGACSGVALRYEK